jgi:cellulose synthase/poly-beta-1,6-N-acetylglucosamine synthase-like glycosyltransferase
MYRNLITIVIPVKEKESIVGEFLLKNMELLTQCKVIVIDREGGKQLKEFSDIYERGIIRMTVARKHAYSLVKTPFILNLDVDNILPKGYVDEALLILQNQEDVAVVAIDYEKCLGHYGFGTSLWRTELLKAFYDYKEENALCECVYMWRKVHQAKLKIETLPYRAGHLKVK